MAYGIWCMVLYGEGVGLQENLRTFEDALPHLCDVLHPTPHTLNPVADFEGKVADFEGRVADFEGKVTDFEGKCSEPVCLGWEIGWKLMLRGHAHSPPREPPKRRGRAAAPLRRHTPSTLNPKPKTRNPWADKCRRRCLMAHRAALPQKLPTFPERGRFV